MKRGTLLALILLLPIVAHGATLEGERTVVLSESPPDNTYLAGANVRVAVPVPADLSAVGADVSVDAPVAGDVLIGGARIDVEGRVSGDVRVAGARVSISGPVGGDLSAIGGVVLATGKADDIQIMGGTVRVTGGATGHVTIYGSDVYLSGTYDGNVDISASDRISVADGTVIKGTLRYNAPQEAAIAQTASIAGGAQYTGAAKDLPSLEEAKRYAIAGAGVFFLVKALAALVAAGLIVGLFPELSRRVLQRSGTRSPKTHVLLALLGFALLILVPVAILLLLVSFVGIGVALIFSAMYFLMLLLAYVYAGLLAGAALIALKTKRMHASWKAAVLGTFFLHVLSLVPYIGGTIVFLLMLISIGALARLLFTFSWGAGRELFPD